MTARRLVAFDLDASDVKLGTLALDRDVADVQVTRVAAEVEQGSRRPLGGLLCRRRIDLESPLPRGGIHLDRYRRMTRVGKVPLDIPIGVEDVMGVEADADPSTALRPPAQALPIL